MIDFKTWRSEKFKFFSSDSYIEIKLISKSDTGYLDLTFELDRDEFTRGEGVGTFSSSEEQETGEKEDENE